MGKKLLSTLIASLFAAAPAFAQSEDDTMRVEGSGTIGGIYNNQKVQDSSKLEEYQDLGNGALSNVFARGRNSTNWFEGYGENFGRTDQYMFLRGGIYDIFKAGMYLNDMPHNFASPALTPFAGVGSGLLVATFPQVNPANWNSFNLGYERRDAGGYFEWQKNNPWYFRVDGNQVKFNGTKEGSAALGTSPGNGYVDLPIPVQYSTTNFGVEGGYQTSKATFALRWDYSKFDNTNDVLSWSNPFFGNLLDTTYLPPDNTFNKFTATGNYRDLPWHGVISARYTWAQTTSIANLGTSQLNSFPTVAASNLTLPDQNTFNGKNVNQSFALGWTAIPITNVDTRVYYYWTKLTNDSDQITYGNAPTMPLPTGLSCGNLPTPPYLNANCQNDLFDYTKNDIGFDVWWRFAKNQRLGFGYDYLSLDQNRVDYDKSHTNKAWLEYKNTMLDTLTGRLKYQYIKRDSTLNYSNAGVSQSDPNYILPYTSAFDMQDMTANQIKLNLDWNPMPLLGFSFEGNWIQQNYNNVTYGRTDDDRQGYYLSANWGDPNRLMITGFGDWEQVKYPSNHRYVGTVSNGPVPPPGFCGVGFDNCYNPNNPPNVQAYNWSSATKNQTWMIGVGADWPLAPQWLVKASYIYVNNNGDASFSSQNNYGTPIPISNFADSTQQSFNLKALYTLNKNWSFTAGYAYEKYSRNDIATNGYQYTIPYPAVTNNTSQAYGNGINAFTNGNQNIFYLTATYKFAAPPLPAAKVAEAAPPPPPPVVRPTPPPPPLPPPTPALQVQKITLDSNVLFDFDKAVLKPEGKSAIDGQVVGKLAQVQKLEVVLVTGHTDRLGSDAYNQKLSEARANAVRDYLVSKGVDRTKIETIGMGEKQPVVQCDQKELKALINCLQPNRRVDVQVKGEMK
jgi:outer membrane protein OmpA-like peptidoglycan-associated protein